MTYWSGLIRGERESVFIEIERGCWQIVRGCLLSNDGLSISLNFTQNSPQDSPRDSPCRIVMQHQEPDKLGRS